MDYEREKETDRLKTKNDESVPRIIIEAREAEVLRKLKKELLEHINKHSREEIIDSQIYIVLYYAYNSDGEVIDVFADDMYFPSKDNAITFLLERDYKHVRNGEYSLSRYLHAKIKLLNVDNTTELLSLITKRMSEKGIELNHVDLYEQAVSINNEVKVCIGYNWFLVHKVGRGGGTSYYSTVEMLDRVLELLTENDWLPGDAIEAYGEWFTLVVQDDGCSEDGNKYQFYRLLDENYILSDRILLEGLKRNYVNVSLEKRLKQ